MATEIHPSAVVAPGAQIGENVSVGPFCTVAASAVIGDGSTLQSHIVVDENTTVGKNCSIFPFASIGTRSQDLKWKEGNQCYTSVGDNTMIREYVTIHAGTDHDTWTKVGNDCALLALSHVGHNCEVGNNVVLSHNATLGGHVIVEDSCNIGGLAAVHQFCRIGTGALVAGMAKVVQDILPFTIAEGEIGRMRVINKIGMQRRGFTNEQIRDAQEAFKTLFMRDLSLEDATADLKQRFRENDPVVGEILRVIAINTRGLARPVKKK